MDDRLLKGKESLNAFVNNLEQVFLCYDVSKNLFKGFKLILIYFAIASQQREDFRSGASVITGYNDQKRFIDIAVRHKVVS